MGTRSLTDDDTNNGVRISKVARQTTMVRQSNKDDKYNDAASFNVTHVKGPGGHQILETLHRRQCAMLGDVGVSGKWGGRGNVVEIDGHG